MQGRLRDTVESDGSCPSHTKSLEMSAELATEHRMWPHTEWTSTHRGQSVHRGDAYEGGQRRYLVALSEVECRRCLDVWQPILGLYTASVIPLGVGVEEAQSKSCIDDCWPYPDNNLMMGSGA